MPMPSYPVQELVALLCRDSGAGRPWPKIGAWLFHAHVAARAADGGASAAAIVQRMLEVSDETAQAIAQVIQAYQAKHGFTSLFDLAMHQHAIDRGVKAAVAAASPIPTPPTQTRKPQ